MGREGSHHQLIVLLLMAVASQNGCFSLRSFRRSSRRISSSDIRHLVRSAIYDDNPQAFEELLRTNTISISYRLPVRSLLEMIVETRAVFCLPVLLNRGYPLNERGRFNTTAFWELCYGPLSSDIAYFERELKCAECENPPPQSSSNGRPRLGRVFSCFARLSRASTPVVESEGFDAERGDGSELDAVEVASDGGGSSSARPRRRRSAATCSAEIARLGPIDRSNSKLGICTVSPIDVMISVRVMLDHGAEWDVRCCRCSHGRTPEQIAILHVNTGLLRVLHRAEFPLQRDNSRVPALEAYAHQVFRGKLKKKAEGKSIHPFIDRLEVDDKIKQVIRRFTTDINEIKERRADADKFISSGQDTERVCSALSIDTPSTLAPITE